MREYFIGVDVGKNGAIVVQNNQTNKIDRYLIPLIGKELDINGIRDIFIRYMKVGVEEPICIHIVVEDVHAIFGVAAGATFTFGFVAGVIEGIISTLQLPYTKVQPKTWQKMMFEGVREVRKPDTKDKNGKIRKGSIDTKAMALLAAKRLFPNFDLLPTPRCTKPHDGIVDALLMSEYCKRNFR